MSIQEEEWGESMAATRAQLQSRLDVYPRGVVVGEHDGEVVAAASFIRLPSYDLDAQLSWTELTADGWCTNHAPDGHALFGVDLSVSRRAPRSASSQMFAAAITLSVREGTDGLYWGSRLPRYHRYADRMTAAEYVAATNRRGRYLDPEIELYSRIPNVEVIGTVRDYFKDWESGDWGAIFRWRNPVMRVVPLRPFAKQVIGAIYLLDRWRGR